MKRPDCPDEEAMACFVDVLLSKKERNKLKNHLLKCDRCLEAVAIGICLAHTYGKMIIPEVYCNITEYKRI